MDCGPRYAIMDTLPYDRENTSMIDFPLCDDCLREYTDPDDRRYHAQTISCPKCGPKLGLFDREKHELKPPLEETIRLLQEGKILAIKGVGGFHLCCKMDATPLLRERRNRPQQPFALMAPLPIIEKYAHVSEGERALLDSLKRPIVLLRSKDNVPEDISPGLHTVGFMTPYTGLPPPAVPGHRRAADHDQRQPARRSPWSGTTTRRSGGCRPSRTRSCCTTGAS